MRQFTNLYDVYMFDFDGTLFNTLDSLREVYEKGLAAVGYSCTKEEEEGFTHISLDELGRQKGMDEKTRIRFIEAIDEALNNPSSMQKIKIFDDVAPTLDALKKERRLLGIVSGNSEPHIRLVLRMFGLEETFSFVVGSSFDRRPKPYGDCIIEAKKHVLGFPSSNMLYIGDSLQDLETAHNGGVQECLIDREGSHPTYSSLAISALYDLLPPRYRS
jgi:haloacid dehalogenase superfamily, subfamily IA, variant 1 with third motif having Dx(3-4)D or Dx(3-4)E